MAFFSSAFDHIIYTVFYREFRKGYKRHFIPKRWRRDEE